MKECIKCKKIQDEGCFHKNRHHKYGLHNYCKTCRKSEYLVSPERKKERSKELKELHKGNKHALGIKHTPEQVQRKKEYTRGRNFRNGYNYSAGDATSPMRSVFSRYKKNAKKTGRKWEFSELEFHEITKKTCFYCGKKPSLRKYAYPNSDYYYEYNGIDRKNNDEGYTLDNSVSCCECCNRAKLKMSIKDFIEWIKSVYFHSVDANA